MHLNPDENSQPRPCLVSVAREHLERAYGVLGNAIPHALNLDANLRSISHRRQMEAIKPFLDAADQKALQRLERKLDRRLRRVGQLLITIDDAVQQFRRREISVVLDDNDKATVERLNGISSKLRAAFFGKEE